MEIVPHRPARTTKRRSSMVRLTSLYHTAKRLVRTLPPWLLRFRPFGIYEIPLPKSDDAPAAMPFLPRCSGGQIDCQLGWVTGSAEGAMLRHLATKESIATLNSSTRRAAAAWLNGQAIACVWIATESFEECELGLRFELKPNETWLYAAVVDPELRDRGVYRQLLEFLIDELSRADVQRILLGVTFGNEPSLRAHARQGATQVGAITAVRSLGFTFCCRVGRVRRLSPLSLAWRRPIRLVVEPVAVGTPPSESIAAAKSTEVDHVAPRRGVSLTGL
jgi:GNAT superfamily N-acetyltransferase